MNEPPIRHHSASAIDFIANRLGLRNEPGMQDWEFEVAEPHDLSKYLAFFDEVVGKDDVRFALADMIIQAFEHSDFELQANYEWTNFLSALEANIDVHGWQLWQWASWDVDLEEAWRVTPYMRHLCEKHF